MFFNAKVISIKHNNVDYTSRVHDLCESLINEDANTDVSALNTKAIKRLVLEEISNTPALIAKLQELHLKSDTNALTKLLCSPRKITRPPLRFGETSSSRELQRMLLVVGELNASDSKLEFDGEEPLCLQAADSEKLHRGDAYLRRGLAYFKARRFARAYFDFAVARQFKIHDLSVDIDEHMGACLMFMNQYQQAIPYFNAVLKNLPDMMRVGLYRRICEMMSPMPVMAMAQNDNPIYDQMLRGDQHPLAYLTTHVEVLKKHSAPAKVLMGCLSDSQRLSNIMNVYGVERLLDLLEALPLYIYEGEGAIKSYSFNMNKSALEGFLALVSGDDKYQGNAPLLARLSALLAKKVEVDFVEEVQVSGEHTPRVLRSGRSIFGSFTTRFPSELCEMPSLNHSDGNGPHHKRG